MKIKEKIECPICGEQMEKYDFDYNTDSNEKIDYKCPNCGHRQCVIINE